MPLPVWASFFKVYNFEIALETQVDEDSSDGYDLIGAAHIPAAVTES